MNPVKPQVRAGGRGATLSLIVGAERCGPIRRLGWARQVEEAQLSDAHARVEQDRHGRSVGQLEGNVSGETRIDEARG